MKVFVFLAPFVVLAAIVLVSGYVGARIGAAKERLKREGIDPKWARHAEEFIRSVVMPPADMASLDDMVVLPDRLREDGKKILYAAPGSAGRAESRR